MLDPDREQDYHARLLLLLFRGSGVVVRWCGGRVQRAAANSKEQAAPVQLRRCEQPNGERGVGNCLRTWRCFDASSAWATSRAAAARSSRTKDRAGAVSRSRRDGRRTPRSSCRLGWRSSSSTERRSNDAEAQARHLNAETGACSAEDRQQGQERLLRGDSAHDYPRVPDLVRGHYGSARLFRVSRGSSARL